MIPVCSLDVHACANCLQRIATTFYEVRPNYDANVTQLPPPPNKIIGLGSLAIIADDDRMLLSLTISLASLTPPPCKTMSGHLSFQALQV